MNSLSKLGSFASRIAISSPLSAGNQCPLLTSAARVNYSGNTCKPQQQQQHASRVRFSLFDSSKVLPPSLPPLPIVIFLSQVRAFGIRVCRKLSITHGGAARASLLRTRGGESGRARNIVGNTCTPEAPAVERQRHKIGSHYCRYSVS